MLHSHYLTNILTGLMNYLLSHEMEIWRAVWNSVLCCHFGHVHNTITVLKIKQVWDLLHTQFLRIVQHKYLWWRSTVFSTVWSALYTLPNTHSISTDILHYIHKNGMWELFYVFLTSRNRSCVYLNESNQKQINTPHNKHFFFLYLWSNRPYLVYTMQTIRATILEQTTFPVTSINLIKRGAERKFTAHYKYTT